jgi:hypothetical protein
MSNPIDSFNGEYRFLSNFYPAKLRVLGIPYQNSEAAYQAAKTLDISQRELLSNVEPDQAKRMGRKIVLRSDWSLVVKLEVMELCLRAKFMDPKLSSLLTDTGDRELIEGNHWGDTFWGVCRGEGTNYLGKLLMEVRKDLNRWEL